MKLPKGVTGFYETEENKPPQLQLKDVKKKCYDAIHNVKGKVISFKKPSFPKNYYTIHVQIDKLQFFMLVNEHYPLAAFANKVEYGNIQFVDNPKLEHACKQFFTVLSQEVLLSPLDLRKGELLSRLPLDSQFSEVEYDQILYWNPSIVGEIIFNEWA